MGVTCTFYSGTSDQLIAIKEHPPFVKLLWGDTGWLNQRAAFSRLRNQAPACLKDTSSSMQLSLGKAWHGLHFLFAGGAASLDLPPAFIVAGGDSIGHESRLVSPAQALVYGAFVASLTPIALRARFDPAEMARQKVYPEVTWEQDGQGAFDWLLEAFDQLPPFFRDIASEDHGFVATIG